MTTRDVWHVLMDCRHWTTETVPHDAGLPVRAGTRVRCPLCRERVNVRALYLVPT
jgi:hypothetical protein